MAVYEYCCEDQQSFKNEEICVYERHCVHHPCIHQLKLKGLFNF